MTDRRPLVSSLTLVAILSIGLAIRLYNLSVLPMFNDEAIYGRWIQLMLERGHWIISLTDGKLPLFYWLAALATYLLNNPLVALRLIAALAGVAGVYGVYLAGLEIFNRQAALAAAWIYAILPFTVVYDRFGLPDGLLAAIAPLILWSALRVGRNPSWLKTVVLAGTLGSALLVKANAVLLVVPAVVGIFLGARPAMFDQGEGYNRSYPKHNKRRRLVIAAAVALALASVPVLIVVGVMPQGDFIIGKSSSFFLAADDLMDFPVGQWSKNVSALKGWFVSYYQWPGLAALVAALFFSEKKAKAWVGILLFLGIFQILFIGAVANIWFSRYLTAAMPFLIIATAIACYGLAQRMKSERARTVIFLVLLVAITIPAVWQDLLLLSEPTQFAWAADDRWQYIEGWPSGSGFADVTSLIDGKIKKEKNLVILVDANMGYPKDGIELIFSGREGVKIEVFDEKKSLKTSVKEDDSTYIVVTDSPRVMGAQIFSRKHKNWRETAVFHKPGRKSAFRVYEQKAKDNETTRD